MSPKRIQRRRTAGWRMPNGAMYVGRPTKWGNPLKWTDYPATRQTEECGPVSVAPAARRRFAVTDFAAAVQYGIGRFDGYPSAEEIRRELAGRDLVCWCPLDQPCHADVLLKIANSEASR